MKRTFMPSATKALILVAGLFFGTTKAQIINTVAGNGYGAPFSGGYSGDGGPATNAELSAPFGVCLDNSFDIYIADYGNNVIRKVTASTGIISTIAGTGTWGYSGDGGPATNAELNDLEGVCLDTAGNLYIVSDYDVIRKVTASTGIITTIAGIGGINGFSGDGGPATSAELHSPEGIAIDVSGNVYIGDYYNNRVRKVTALTGIISTIAGNGTAGYSGDGGPATNAELKYPGGVAVDTSGNVYIAEVGNNVIRKITNSIGIISTIAGIGGIAGYSGDGGEATNAELNDPLRISLDSTGNIYIADNDNYRIREVTALTGIISTVAGNGVQGFSGDGGPATSAEFYFPKDVALDKSENFYTVDASNRVRKVTANNISTSAEAVNSSLHVFVYPNPFTHMLNVDIGKDDAEITVINVVGQVIYEARIHNYTILSLNLSPGAYFLKLNFKDGHTVIKKVIAE